MCRFLKWVVVLICCQAGWIGASVDAQLPSKGNVTEKFDWETYKALTEPTLAQMSLDNPLLRAAYAQIFLLSGKPTNWELAVRSDLLRRGNAATPVLLSLFEENPESELRAELMGKIEIIPTLDLEPFLNATRALFRKEGLNLPPRTCYQMAWLLERHGTAADSRILEQLRNHPVKEVGFVIKPNIERMTKRLAQESGSDQAKARLPIAPGTATPAPGTPVPVAAPAASPQPAMPVAQTPAVTSERGAPVWPWLVGILTLLAVVALLLKRRA